MRSIIPIPAFSDNYIWLLRKGGHAAVVDPGDAAPVLDYLRRENLALAAILATHHHRDHVGGIEALLEKHPAPVYGPAGERIPACAHPLRERDTIRLEAIDAAFDVLDIPGHTAGHIAYVGLFEDARVLFCGDTLFAAGCGRLFEGTPAQMWSSLGKLARLPADTLVYCGHEYTLANLAFAAVADASNREVVERTAREREKRDRGVPTLPSTIGLELRTNPFLRADEPALRAAAEAHAKQPLTGAVPVFAALRAWKNAF
jgi:hydroxyacylglutathione hydrolase